ncbi:hypothetical protein Tco_1183359 [Tanacetum coccineum]
MHFQSKIFAASLLKSKLKPTRGRQNRMIQNEDTPRHTAWTNEEEIALCKEKGDFSERKRSEKSVQRGLKSAKEYCSIYSQDWVTSTEGGPGGEGVVLEEKGEEQGFDSKEDEVVPKVEDVSLVDGVFDGAFGGDGDRDYSIGEGKEEEEKCDEDDEENEEGDHYLINMRWINVVRHGYIDFGF